MEPEANHTIDHGEYEEDLQTASLPADIQGADWAARAGAHHPGPAFQPVPPLPPPPNTTPEQ